MATRLGRWSLTVVALFGSFLATAAQAQTPAPVQQNQRRTAPTDGARQQPIDPSLQRSQAPGAAGGAPRTASGQSIQPAVGTLPNGAPAQPVPLATAPPFILTPQEQADLDALLNAWEKQSQGVKYFKCSFNRLEYNPAFANGNLNQLTTESHGEIKFAAPDKGMFRVLQMWNYILDPKTQKYVRTPAEPEEWWTCDGKSMFQVDAKQKLVIETPLPPQMQGAAISDGPLPFVFGAKADAIKRRYFIRNTSNTLPPQQAANSILLEVRPKLQKDAANFSMVELIFSKPDMQLQAMQITNPGAGPQTSRTVITFVNPSINNMWAPLAQLLTNFAQPNPLGYTHKVQNPAPQPPPNSANPGQDPIQAGRAPATKRG